MTVAAFSAAADGDGAAADPWKALGVKAGADAEEIKKALDRKKLLYKTEPGKLAKFEVRGGWRRPTGRRASTLRFH